MRRMRRSFPGLGAMLAGLLAITGCGVDERTAPSDEARQVTDNVLVSLNRPGFPRHFPALE